MEQIGKVVDVQGNMVTVIIRRNSMCGENCASCGACTQKNFKIACQNTIGAQLHDSVVIEMKDKYILRNAFIVYILPVLFMIITYLVLDGILQNKALVVFLSFVILALFFFVLHRIDKRLSGKESVNLVKIADRSM